MSTNDHSQLLNREAPDQHPADAITYAGAPLNAELDTVRTGLADRPTFVQVDADYYNKPAIDAQMATKAPTAPVTATENGLATPDLHTFSAYSDIGLTEVNAEVPPPGTVSLQSGKIVDGRRYFIGFVTPKAFDSADTWLLNGRPVTMRMADGAPPPDGLFAGNVQKIASLDATDPSNYILTFEADPRGSAVVGILDATCTTTGTCHELTIPNFVPPFPDIFTVRTTMDADYVSGNEFSVAGTIFAARTAANDPAPDKIVGADATVEIVFNSTRGLAFFRSGVGNGASPGARAGWNVSVGGEAPVFEGIHVSDAVSPSKIYMDSEVNPRQLKIRQVALGSRHTLFLLDSGKVWSCGSNQYGQLGRSAPVGNYNVLNLGEIPGLENVVQIAASNWASYFLKKDGTVFRCGDYTNTAAELSKIPYCDNVVNMSASSALVLFLFRNGTVSAAGSTGGAIPTLDKDSRTIPNLTEVRHICAGNSYCLFIRADGTVWSCGDNLHGNLGDVDKSRGKYNSPLSVNAKLRNVEKIVAGNYCTFFIFDDGRVFAAGENRYGLLGRASKDYYGYVEGLDNVENIAVGANHTLFLLKDRSVWSCGYNLHGQLIRPTLPSETTNPIPMATNLRCEAIFSGSCDSSFLLDAHGVLNCGINSYGELGRLVQTGRSDSVNLGKVEISDAIAPHPIPTHYEEEALLIRYYGVYPPSRVCIFDNGDSRIHSSPAKVYQVENNALVEKEYLLRRGGSTI